MGRRTTQRNRARRTSGLVSVVVIVLLLVIGLASGILDQETDAAPAPPAPATTQPSAPAPTATPGSALDLLASLPVKGRAAKTGYDRAQFGPRWQDVDRNGCDTRNDTLGAQLTDPVRDGRCKVTAGTLHDPYTGTTIHFVRGQGTSELVQIDHVVALSDAWQKGAQALTAEQRTALANDPLNLLAVDGASNSQKRDGDAATWLPKNKDFRCEYVARQIAVKARYDLWVTPAEHDAVARVLSTCPDEPVPTH
ncbi:HNH endonuclease family protein [Microbacterium sp. NPDC057659]|uniref:HNH endonuclease family protein n=1 Tax=Microbacterium sp. NPDC057659 TaxID=3346198 RepID=UPI00366ED40A